MSYSPSFHVGQWTIASLAILDNGHVVEVTVYGSELQNVAIFSPHCINHVCCTVCISCHCCCPSAANLNQLCGICTNWSLGHVFCLAGRGRQFPASRATIPAATGAVPAAAAASIWAAAAARSGRRLCLGDQELHPVCPDPVRFDPV